MICQVLFVWFCFYHLSWVIFICFLCFCLCFLSWVLFVCPPPFIFFYSVQLAESWFPRWGSGRSLLCGSTKLRMLDNKRISGPGEYSLASALQEVPISTLKPNSTQISTNTSAGSLIPNNKQDRYTKSPTSKQASMRCTKLTVTPKHHRTQSWQSWQDQSLPTIVHTTDPPTIKPA